MTGPAKGWRPAVLRDLVEFQRGFDITQAQQAAGPYPVISSSGVTSYHEKAMVVGPGVIIGRKGSIGALHFCEGDYWPHDTTLWSKSLGKNNPRFAYYYLHVVNLKRFDVGNSNPTLNRNHIHDLPIRIPSRPTQDRIADILSAYDDLIENNRRRMALLEEAARQLYREWFVRLRFPGHEHTRIVDGVPDGWERVLTPDAIELNPKTKLLDAEQHTFVEMADLPTDSLVVQQTKRKSGRSGSRFMNGDTLFARITPCLENGKTAFVDFLTDGEVGRGSTEFIVLRSRRLTPELVYLLSRTYDFRENAIKSMVGSSGRQRVQESCFEKFWIHVPSPFLLDLFTDAVRPTFRLIQLLHQVNQKLRAARDLLLPRLMSGEIAV